MRTVLWILGLVLMANTNNYIPDKGGVGLWTKADAATAFDSFTVVARY